MRRRLPLALLLVALLFCRPRGGSLAAGELPQAARWLQQYLRIDTTNPPGGEHLAAAYLARLLEAAGIAAQVVVTASGRANLVARLDAPGTDEALLLLHHMDVVAARGDWQHDPFGGELADGRLWGRGALDAKSLGIAQLAAVVALQRSGLPPRRDVVLLATADEERGGQQGAGWLLDERPDLFQGVVAVLNEGGANRYVNGRFLWWGVEVAQKRPLWLTVTARARGGHAAGFHPASAPHRLVRALDRLLALTPDWRVTPAVRQYLSALAPLHNPHWQQKLAEPDGFIGPDGPRGLLPGMANLFLDTVQVTVLAAGEQVNVVPEEASAEIDVRMLPDTDEEALLARLRAALGADVEVTVRLTAPPAGPSPTDHPVWRLLEATLGSEAPVVPAFASGFTDSRWFRARGIPAYGFSPFTLELEDQWGIHAADERIPVAALMEGVARYEAVVRGWAGAP